MQWISNIEHRWSLHATNDMTAAVTLFTDNPNAGANLPGHELAHVSRAGEVPLEAGVAGQLLHVAVHHPGHRVVFA